MSILNHRQYVKYIIFFKYSEIKFNANKTMNLVGLFSPTNVGVQPWI